MILDSLLTVLLIICKLCLGDSGNYKHYRLESLCKSDLAKVRLRLGTSAAGFRLNSSLVPGTEFNCHLELALDSSKLGFFVYFEDLSVTPSKDCVEDYVQFGRDILFITSFRSAKFCHKIQGNFPTVNKTTVTTLDPSTTTMSKRTYSESTDQEMDVWLRLKVSPSSPLIKTVSFTVTPFLLTCSGRDVGYRRCGQAGHCVRSQFFCDGAVNCPVNNSMWPADETDCKSSSRAVTDLDGSEWEGSQLYIIVGPGVGVLVLILFVIVVYHKFPSVLNIPPLSKPYTQSSASTRQPDRVVLSTQYEYHTGHIVPVRRAAPPPPSMATAPPLPRCPPAYTDIVQT